MMWVHYPYRPITAGHIPFPKFAPPPLGHCPGFYAALRWGVLTKAVVLRHYNGIMTKALVFAVIQRVIAAIAQRDRLELVRLARVWACWLAMVARRKKLPMTETEASPS